MTTRKDLLVSWLNDAYAMEQAVAQVLEKQVDQTKDFPMVQDAIRTHLEQTRHHAELDKQAVEHLGGSISSIKSGLANIMGFMQGLTTSPAADTVVKDGITDFAVEHFEIASYRAIIAAAQELGDQFVIQCAQEILPQEEWMAQFLAQHLPTVVQETMNRLTAGAASS